MNGSTINLQTRGSSEMGLGEDMTDNELTALIASVRAVSGWNPKAIALCDVAVGLARRVAELCRENERASDLLEQARARVAELEAWNAAQAGGIVRLTFRMVDLEGYTETLEDRYDAMKAALAAAKEVKP